MQNDAFSAKRFIFGVDNHKLKLFVVMVTLQYYDEIEKAVKAPSAIIDLFDSTDYDSNEEKLFYSFMLEVGLPVEEWLFYVVTHEENAFKLYFDCKPNENDRRLSPKELFYCLRHLSDENRRSILGKLSNISDGVINKLSIYVEENSFAEFSNVINEMDINTSSITAICMKVNALIDYYYAIEQFYLNIDQIVQIDNEAEALRQMEKVFNVYLSNIERFINDEQATDNIVNQVNNLFESLSRNEDFSKVASNLTISKYHSCLWLYHHINNIQPDVFATRVSLDYLEQLVFNPKYEKFWKDYEDDSCLGELDNEMEGSAADLEKKVGNTKRWRLQRYLSRQVECGKDSLKHCQGIRENIINKGDDKLTKFIQGIAKMGYIDNDPITKNSFAYALTGRGGFKTKIIKVRWHHTKAKKSLSESVRVLLYISSKMFLTKKETYTQLFEVLDAGPNPCIKDGKDQSSSYSESVSEEFKKFFESCFGFQ